MRNRGCIDVLTIITSLILTSLFSHAQVQSIISEENEKEVFSVTDPDYELSPYTGVTMKHWYDAASYLLEGAFGYIDDIDDPMQFPKLSGKSYPTSEDQIPTEKLEGLCRTLFIAAPLLRKNPSLVVNGVNVSEYYRHQILNLLDSTHASFIRPRAHDEGPSQILVEFGALAISLFVAPEALWDPLSKQHKDLLASTMLSYGDGPTIPSNWRFFNIFILSFFKEQGYEINEVLMKDYLQKSLEHYRSNGWYNDAPAYDYYSMWAFQLYGIIWAEYFGKENYPDIAGQFVSNFKDLEGNYPYLFSEDGKMIMWGRSISYRFASISPLPFTGLQGESFNYGWMRRISSGVLLQFLQNPSFLKDDVPTLGFYGHYEPAVQIYSCRGSVYWMGKAFLGLLIQQDNPFWTSIENNGPWESDFESDQVYNHFQGKTNILITNYTGIGASEVRAWCHEKVADDWQKFRSSENYNRLSYNSSFPWQADGSNGEVAMNYVVKNALGKWEAFRLYDFKKFESGVYYRDVELETDSEINIQLAEMPMPNGVLRVDRNLSSKTMEVRLGHYALPKLDDEIRTTTRDLGKYKATIIDNGVYQLAMVPLAGWDEVEIVNCSGLHPESDQSTVLNATSQFSPEGGNIYSTLLLWKKSGEKWKKSELMPVKKFSPSDGGVLIRLRKGKEKELKVNYYNN
ncbi:DUF2264 domain-containing protein [Marinoscillum sp. MHG1-6]|uniref:DUF2264 domain-containing protein n=1 Tax=Marinoscillum sp. MHG1-6 TaxID=2959627 RepID=UPI0021573C5E|nr:DUF2264 domain-containing protein [Marinoscillum sp. MHG1-6]